MPVSPSLEAEVRAGEVEAQVGSMAGPTHPAWPQEAPGEKVLGARPSQQQELEGRDAAPGPAPKERPWPGLSHPVPLRPNAERSGDFLERSHTKVPPRQISPPQKPGLSTSAASGLLIKGVRERGGRGEQGGGVSEGGGAGPAEPGLQASTHLRTQADWTEQPETDRSDGSGTSGSQGRGQEELLHPSGSFKLGPSTLLPHSQGRVRFVEEAEMALSSHSSWGLPQPRSAQEW